MVRRIRMPVTINTRGYPAVSAMKARKILPNAMPAKRPENMTPLIFPRSFLFEFSIANASAVTSRNPMPI